MKEDLDFRLKDIGPRVKFRRKRVSLLPSAQKRAYRIFGSVQHGATSIARFFRYQPNGRLIQRQKKCDLA
jgi:hypothetical protein